MFKTEEIKYVKYCKNGINKKNGFSRGEFFVCADFFNFNIA